MRPELQSKPRSTTDLQNRHLWQITAARDVIILILIGAFLWLVYLLGDIFIPLLLALVLAHVFNPLINWLERKWGCPRPLTITRAMANRYRFNVICLDRVLWAL